MFAHPAIKRILDAIESRDERRAIQLIAENQTSQDPSKPNLFAFRSEDDQALLTIAFEDRCYSVADSLLKFAFQEKELSYFNDFCELDKTGCHVFHFAANAPNEIFKRLFDFYEFLSSQQNFSTPKWLARTHCYGRSVLHAICNVPTREIQIENIKLLLIKVSEIMPLVDFIDWVDKLGNSAFSYLFSTVNTTILAREVIVTLLSCQANPFISNNLNQNLMFNFLHSESIEQIGDLGLLMGHCFKNHEQLLSVVKRKPILLLDTTINGVPVEDHEEFKKISDIHLMTRPDNATLLFSLAPSEEQAILLHVCKKLLYDKPHLNKVKDFYFRCLGAHESLKKLMIEQCNFNANIPRQSRSTLPLQLPEGLIFYYRDASPEDALTISQLIAKDREFIANVSQSIQKLLYKISRWIPVENKLKNLNNILLGIFLIPSLLYSLIAPDFSLAHLLLLALIESSMAIALQLIINDMVRTLFTKQPRQFEDRKQEFIRDLENKILQPLFQVAKQNDDQILADQCSRLISDIALLNQAPLSKGTEKIVYTVQGELIEIQAKINVSNKPFLLFSGNKENKTAENVKVSARLTISKTD